VLEVGVTVSELIEELQRLPPDRPVLIESSNGFDYGSGTESFELGSVLRIREDQAFAHKQPVVIVSASPYCT
jgi:hypothetical protein